MRTHSYVHTDTHGSLDTLTRAQVHPLPEKCWLSLRVGGALSVAPRHTPRRTARRTTHLHWLLYKSSAWFRLFYARVVCKISYHVLWPTSLTHIPGQNHKRIKTQHSPRTQTYAQVRSRTRATSDSRTHTHTHTHVQHTHMHLHLHTHACTRAYMHANAHKHTHANTHTHTHTHTHISQFPSYSLSVSNVVLTPLISLQKEPLTQIKLSRFQVWVRRKVNHWQWLIFISLLICTGLSSFLSTGKETFNS